jgi:leucyl-tRNA synthetase
MNILAVFLNRKQANDVQLKACTMSVWLGTPHTILSSDRTSGRLKTSKVQGPNMQPYHPKAIETAMQARWKEQKTFYTNTHQQDKTYYVLSMFPYPSGNLHMGHVRNYTLGDVIARHARLTGHCVLQPTGWDAFGLPAENAAIQKQIPPADWTHKNIAQMKKQLEQLGLSYDWDKEITTCDPRYYRWTQWLFIQMFKKGLAYRKKAWVNWDPVDQTVLANEQVIDGRGWRSNALIERKEIHQWFLKITDYTQPLLDDLDTLPNWPNAIKQMQTNWIGASTGCLVHFDVQEKTHDTLLAFTTRPDTLMGVSALALSSEHPLADSLAKNNPSIKAFIADCQHTPVSEQAIATLEQKGIDTGLTATHPITQKHIPIWITNYVLMQYGTGVVMVVPAHDARDFSFAKRYELPILPVIKPKQQHDFDQKPHTQSGFMFNSGQWDDMHSEKAIDSIIQTLEKQGKGQRKTTYRLRDWGISRQRYWGTPIPMIDCKDCGMMPVPEKDLPVKLPTQVTFDGVTSPLKTMKAFYDTTCPQCKKPATRETDTFDTFMDSSWYYARFICADNDSKMIDERAKHWLPVDHYIGGIEHATMHLLYARFIHKVLFDLGLVANKEPFDHLLSQGMVLKDGSKMSKSKGNVVAPEALLNDYGADTLRLFVLFAAPPEQSLEWSDAGVQGAHRFLKRLWQFAMQLKEKKEQGKHSPMDEKAMKKAQQQFHQILKQINRDMARHQFNTVISGVMKWVNLLHETPQSMDLDFSTSVLQSVLKVLAPISPHLSEYLWSFMDYDMQTFYQGWPEHSESYCQTDEVEWVIQINGKIRDRIVLSSGLDNASCIKKAMNHAKIQRALTEKTVVKTIVVPQKLINFVVKDNA